MFLSTHYFIHTTHQKCPFNCPRDELITIFSHLESFKDFCCSYITDEKEWDIRRERGGDISSAWFNGINTHDRKWPDIKLLYIVYRVALLLYYKERRIDRVKFLFIAVSWNLGWIYRNIISMYIIYFQIIVNLNLIFISYKIF